MKPLNWKLLWIFSYSRWKSARICSRFICLWFRITDQQQQSPVNGPEQKPSVSLLCEFGGQISLPIFCTSVTSCCTKSCDDWNGEQRRKVWSSNICCSLHHVPCYTGINIWIMHNDVYNLLLTHWEMIFRFSEAVSDQILEVRGAESWTCQAAGDSEDAIVDLHHISWRPPWLLMNKSADPGCC